MVVASVSALGYFVPIFAFLLVFFVVYALLAKTGILGGSHAVSIFVSFILAVFFIVYVSLVDFIQFSSVWFGVLVIGLFLIMTIFAFLPSKEPLDFLVKNNWFSWVLIGLIIALFIISSVYVFNWAINWDLLRGRFSSGVAGTILLLIIAAVVSWKIKG